MSTPDFFCARLAAMIDLHHPLAVLAANLRWEELEGALLPLFAHKERAGVGSNRWVRLAMNYSWLVPV